MNAMVASGRRSGRRLALVMALLLIIALGLALLLLGRTNAFRPLAGSGAAAPALPGVTVEPDPADAAPIVTSLRSNSEAERLGVRVGDRIAAVDGHPVPDVASLRARVAQHDGAFPVALHIRRGNGVWSVAIPRRDPASADEQDAPAPIS